MVKASSYEYIFFTGEGLTQSPTGCQIENMQVLGFAKGNSEISALKKLLEDNPWIEKMGYSSLKIISRRISF